MAKSEKIFSLISHLQIDTQNQCPSTLSIRLKSYFVQLNLRLDKKYQNEGSCIITLKYLINEQAIHKRAGSFHPARLYMKINKRAGQNFSFISRMLVYQEFQSKQHTLLVQDFSHQKTSRFQFSVPGLQEIHRNLKQQKKFNSCDGFFRKSPFCTFSCINPGFGGPWDML